MRRSAAGIILLLLLVLINCASFAGRLEGEIPEPAGRTNVLRSRLFFAGWERYPGDVENITRLFLEKGVIRDNSSSGIVVVVLEESESTNGLLRLANLIVTILSSLVIPFYNQVNHRISYRYMQEGRTACSFETTTRNHEVIGILFLPFSPFFWPPLGQSELLVQTARQFLAHCAEAFVSESAP